MIPRILVIPGLPGSSPAAALVSAAAVELAVLGADVTRISPEDHPLPLLGADPATDATLPSAARRLADLVAAHDAVLVAMPEINASLPALLKNMLDWTARAPAHRGVSIWADKPVALVVASDEPGRGEGAAAHLAAILAHLGASVIGDAAVLGVGDDTGEADGLDEADAARLKALCRSLERAANLQPD